MKTTHWLDKAEPSYAPSNHLWRVRITHKKTPYNWWLKSGKGDGGATGKALAHAEWGAIKAKIVADERAAVARLGEQPDGILGAGAEGMPAVGVGMV